MSSPPSARLSQLVKLVDGARFTAIFANKRRQHSAHFSAHVATNGLSHPRMGLAVSRRVSKKAVERNRLKRIIRESFRHHLHELGAVDFIVVAKASAASQPNPVLRRELDSLWSVARQKCADQ